MKEMELPMGWATALLEELISNDGLFSDGDWVESKDQDPEGKIRLLQLADIGDSIFLDKSQRFVNNEQYERLRCTEVLEGDILIARMPDPLGRACLVPALGQRMITVVDVAIVRPGQDSFMPKWLMYVINAPQIRGSIELQSTGTTRRRITRKKLSALELQIAPLTEQRRIAAKLDTTLAAVEACRQRLDAVAAILKRFRQAVLAAATSGELTREWREERGLQEDWQEVQLGDHAEGFNYGTSAKSQSEGEIPVLRMGNIQSGEIDWGGLVYTSDLVEIAKYMLEPGDVLFNRTNSPELVGKTAIYRGEQPAIYAGYLIRVRCSASLDPEFLNLSLNSPEARDYCWRVKSDGVSQSNINAKKLAAYAFELPPIEEQHEIIRCAQDLFALAVQLEARLNAARKVVDRLTPALLAKAFRGELVPQDPSDEPASVLLERIRAARQAEAGAGKPSRRGRPKAAANPDQLPLDAAPVPPDFLAALLRECGALSERALLAVSELEPERFQNQLRAELELGRVREFRNDGQMLLELAP